MEFHLRRLEGIDKIAISMRRQTMELTFASGARFEPEEIRYAVGNADVEILNFRVTAHGRVEEKGSERVFVAGRDRFLLTATPSGMPLNKPLWVSGEVDDYGDVLKLQIMQFKPLKEQPSEPQPRR